MSYKKWIGIDVSKDVIDLSIFDGKNHKHHLVKNNKKELKKFFSKFKSREKYHVIMEATGIYHLVLFKTLVALKFDVSIVNPLIIKRYSEMKMIRAKTDIVDARLIAQFGFEQKPKLSQQPNEVQEEIYALFKAVSAFKKDTQSLKNRLSALMSCESKYKIIIKELKKHIRANEKSIDNLKKKIAEIIEKNFSDLNRRLQEISGVGPITSSMIIGVFGKFENFETAKQVVGFVGLNPNPRISGTSVNRGSNISKRGNSLIRKILYLAALSAKQHNPDCKNLYDRLLQKGKPKVKAQVAVANKLLRQIFAIAKYDREWKADYVKKS